MLSITMSKKKDIWNIITASLKPSISASEFNTWFSNTTLKQLGPELAIIEVPNKFVKNWIHDNYTERIRNCFNETIKITPVIRFTYKKTQSSQETNIITNCTKSKINLNHQLSPSFTFDNFVTSKNNQFAYSSALQVAKNPAGYYNPLYIFCKLSLGKTHLINAIGFYILKTNPLTRIKYFSIDQFFSGFSISKKKQVISAFRNKYRSLDFLILDDIHILSGRKKSQEELVYLLNMFLESNKQIVMAGQNPPNKIKDLMPELRSRLEWGLLTEIQPPDYKTKIKIIKIKSKEENVSIPDDVSLFLANSTNDLKKLTRFIISLKTYSSLYHHKIDMSTVKSVINRDFKKIEIHDIQKVTAAHFNITVSDLLSNKKGRSFSCPRHIAMYLCRKRTSHSFKEIGQAFDNRDHSTVIYSVKKIEKQKFLKKEIFDAINKLHRVLS